MIPVAVVGIDCRFPGAPDKEALWRMMMDGVVAASDVPAQRWDADTYYRCAGATGSINTRRAHFIDEVDAFDNEFFGIAPVEAAALDPQQRMLLQSSWRALEYAGIDPTSLTDTPTGVYVGMMSSEWSSLQLHDLAHLNAIRGTGAGSFMVANRISYHLGLNGPSVVVDTACSSSLTAVHQGCAALRAGDVDTAIVGGTNLILTPALSIFYTQAGLSAPDGRCNPFQRDADGIGRGEGIATVILRRLDDALADGAPIYAVVRVSAANHDGRSNGITAPSRRSQAALMRKALSVAEIDAAQIAFVEAHGTGTTLGDMVEVNSLGDIHRARRDELCLLGSVKGNIGHTEGSAGISAFIKAGLALQRRVLPPSVISAGASPELRLADNGLRLAETPQVLAAPEAFGAVSSFGIGGSNAHVIAQSPPPRPAPAPGPMGALTISAPSENALRRNAHAMAAALASVDTSSVAGWCRSTNVVKRAHRYRLAMDGDRDALIEVLRQAAAGSREFTQCGRRRRGPASVGLLFPGQGAQFRGMTRALYETNTAYQRNLDVVATVVSEHLKTPVIDEIFSDGGELDHTTLVQPALFSVSVALGRTLLQSGVRAAFGVGHSAGEIAAACLAGVLSLDAAAELVTTRARLMGSLPAGGAMVATELDVDEARDVIADAPGCAIAAINSPAWVTISGPASAMLRIEELAQRRGKRARRLSVSHAFHSPLMEPAAAELRRSMSHLDPKPADFPLFSTLRGGRIDGREMTADYWAEQLFSTVRFHDTLKSALAGMQPDYLAESGPGSVLTSSAIEGQLSSAATTLLLCHGAHSQGSELLSVAATLMRHGFSPDLNVLCGEPSVPWQRIPPYVFDDSTRFWFQGTTGDLAPRVHTLTAETAVLPWPDRHTGSQPGDLADGVVALIAQVGRYPVSAVDRSKRLAEDLGYDSLLQLALLDRLRTEYPQLGDVDVTELLPRIQSVGDIVEFVVGQLARTV